MNSLSFRTLIGNILKQQGILLVFILLLIGISFDSSKFLTISNILMVISQASLVGVIAVAMTLVMIGGEIDLSVGSLLSLTVVLVVSLHDKVGPGMAIIITLGVALLIGCFNGIMVGFFKMDSLITTLAMLPALQGVTLIYSGGLSYLIENPNQTWFRYIGNYYLWKIPISVIIFFGIAAILSILLTKTSFGRQLIANGGNRTASEFSGVRTKWVVFITFLLTAACTGIAAVIMGSQLMSSQNSLGQGYELNAIAAVILGGTSLFGGSGSVFKTVIGVLILSFIANGFILLGFPYYVQWLVEWFIIIAAVWLDLVSKRGKILV